jgi:hypothetical protein
MDTKALEPVFKLKSMITSRFGCPYCRCAHGQFNSWTSIYGGNRQFLTEYHYFRFLGNRGNCYPECFYSPEGDWFVDEQFYSSDKPIMAENLIRKIWSFHRDLVFTLFLKNVPQNVPFFYPFPITG